MRIKQLELRIKRPKVILALFFILYSLFFISPVFAQDIGFSRLSPESPLYFLKAVREVFEIKFAGTEKVRILRRLEFAERRLREANSLTAVHREDLIAPNMEKFLLEVSLVRPVKDKSTHTIISASLGHYMEALVTLYGNLKDPKAKRAVRSAAYRLMGLNDTYYTGLSRKLVKQLFESQAVKFSPGCTLLTQEASSSALNESERQVLKERGVKCEGMINAILKLPQIEE